MKDADTVEAVVEVVVKPFLSKSERRFFNLSNNKQPTGSNKSKVQGFALTVQLGAHIVNLNRFWLPKNTWSLDYI